MRGVRHAGAWAVAVVLTATVACSGGGPDAAPEPGRADTPATTAEPAPAPTAPRYRTEGVRLVVDHEQPLAIYNVYPSGAQPELISDVVDLWPADLLPLLAIQVIASGLDELPEDEQVAALDALLDESDRLEVPVIVQTQAFSGPHGPGLEAMDAAFDEHPSLVGIGVAELSADFDSAVGGLQPEETDQLVERFEQAIRHDAVLLWADMGYFGPQVFVDAGADPRLYDLMSAHPENLIVQAKQNGAGRRFGTQSAAFGLFAAGLASAWGVNSEDWLWWEASLEGLGDPQVPGGLTGAGMVRSDHPTRSRLTYPEALFGTEMLVAAASGGAVFSIEAPPRGTVDPDGSGATSPAGENVVFPVLRRLVRDHLIPDRDTVASRVRLAYQPETRDDPAFADDRAFSGLYGPEGCTDDDRLSCAQRQWLPSTGRYGIVPTLPVLAPAAVTDRFPTVVAPSAGDDEERRAVAEAAGVPAGADGDSWAVPAADEDTWFVANPNENADVTTTFTLPPIGDDGTTVGGRFGPHTFAVVAGGGGGAGPSVLVDNYRTDSERLWDEDISEEALSRLPLDEVGRADPASTVVTFGFGPSSSRRRAEVDGDAEVDQAWDADTGTLTVTLSHRSLVEITIT